MKLNLGCGSDIRPDYVNVDLRMIHPDVVELDLSVRPWPWADGSVDEVMMLDFLEHFPMVETVPILRECARIMKRGGLIQIQVPDMDVLGMAVSRRAGIPCHKCGGIMEHISCSKCGALWPSVQMAAIARIYGGQDYPGNFHQAGFTKELIIPLLDSVGFRAISFVDQEHQYLNWNFKVIARKF